jgi:Ca-activated chloride channel family protein
MSFALPQLLWLLVLPAALLVWELLRGRRLAGISHPKILRAEAGLRTVSLTEGAGPTHAGRRRFLLCAGLALGVVALARPQWGRLDEPVFDQSREIIIALDLSRSMLTTDVKPSRLERSKLLIEALLDRLKGERVGLVVFSGTAFLQSPVSADYEILREFLPSLGPDFLPEGGTNYGQLIAAAAEGFGDGAAADRYLIILSDGEATDDNWKDRIPQLTKKNIKVIGLGVGTTGGGMIPDGSGGFMKDASGAVVMSKLEGGTLRELANATHGVYRDASEWVDLSQVIAATVDAGRKGRFVESRTIKYVERYQWALAQALVCLVASFWLEFPVRPKPRAIRLSAPASPVRRAVATVAALLAALGLSVRPAAAADPAPPDPAASLSKIVGRLANQASQSALDWAELSRETVTWGQHLKSASQEVPAGPVHDALRAVDLGAAADPKASDWPQMKSELEELLKKPDEQKQDQNKNQDQKQDKDQKEDEKKDQDQKPPEPKDSRPDPSKPGSQGKPDPAQGQNPPTPQPPSGEKTPPRDSAFGDMKAPTPAPTPGRREASGATQKVGGAKKPDDPARNDPELAVPLEKLEQVKNQDSPAELFQMLHKDDPLPPPAAAGKNW